MIDLDHNAGAPLDPRVAAAMSAWLQRSARLGNPSSVHGLGRAAREQLEAARRAVAASVGADPEGVVFVGSGTEACNLGLLGLGRRLRRTGRPSAVVSSALEHPAVRSAIAQLEREGHRVVAVTPDPLGRIGPEALAACLRDVPEVGIVALTACHHELGNAYDLARLREVVAHAAARAALFVDGIHGFGRVALDFAATGLDLLALSSAKIGGPAGAGALVCRRGLELDPLLHGGEQERGRRPGTEALLPIEGFGRAAVLAADERLARRARTESLRARLAEGLIAGGGVRIHGDPEHHGGNTVFVEAFDCDAHLLAIALDLEGFAVSTGAACSSGTSRPSDVLRVIGRPRGSERSGLRISLGHGNTEAEIDALLAIWPGVLARVRSAGLGPLEPGARA